MGRRSRPKKDPPKPFADAFAGIDTLEGNVIRRTMDAQFTAEQVVRWMFPDDVVDKLKAAYPLIRPLDRTSHITEKVAFSDSPIVAHFHIATTPIKMLVPEPNRVAIQRDRGVEIMKTVQSVYEQHRQFEKVRKVVRWLNDYATVGAARHYCPWLTSVLPADHPFQSATGLTYQEPRMSMVGVMGTMRECAAIMAAGLLCGEVQETRSAVGVQFSGVRHALHEDPYMSNEFMLV